jgi:hypothetical protein
MEAHLVAAAVIDSWQRPEQNAVMPKTTIPPLPSCRFFMLLVVLTHDVETRPVFI